MMLGRYEVLGHLASGGMAEVLLARLHGPSGFERPVVLKRILPHLARSAGFRQMFLDEARLAAKIRHPNVVLVSELAEEAGELFLAMEYLEGESLSGLLRRLTARGERLSLELSAHVVAEACAGLHAAHELRGDDGEPLGLVHRDVSPQNVFVSYSGDVKVLDFGIAKAQGQESKTDAGQTKGKLEYMSPEQCLGHPLDRRSDVFSLGIVLHEIVTGRRLFKRSTPLLSLEAIVREPVVPPSRVVDDVPEELDRIVLKALATRRDDRYATAAELRRDLVAFVGVTAPGRTLDEALAERMQLLFEDRRREKEEMLRRVRAGSDLTRLPPAEVDEAVEVPAISPDVMTIPMAEQVAEPTDRVAAAGPSRSPVLWGAGVASVAGILAGALTISGLTARPSEGPRGPVATPAAPTNVAPPSATTSSAEQTKEDAGPAEVSFSVESRPAGASIFVDGQTLGTTPAELRLPSGVAPRRVELRKDGYEPSIEHLSFERDQALRVTLTRRAAPAPKKPTSGKKPPNPLETKW